MRRILITLSLAGLLLAAACSGDDDGKVVVRDDLVIRTVDITTSVPSTVAVPDDFPDVPLPAGMSVEDTSVIDEGVRPIWDATGWHGGDAVTIGIAYEKALIEDGFTINTRTEADASLFLSVSDGEWFLSAGFFADPVRLVGTSIGITVTPLSATG